MTCKEVLHGLDSGDALLNYVLCLNETHKYYSTGITGLPPMMPKMIPNDATGQ